MDYNSPYIQPIHADVLATGSTPSFKERNGCKKKDLAKAALPHILFVLPDPLIFKKTNFSIISDAIDTWAMELAVGTGKTPTVMDKEKEDIFVLATKSRNVMFRNIAGEVGQEYMLAHYQTKERRKAMIEVLLQDFFFCVGVLPGTDGELEMFAHTCITAALREMCGTISFELFLPLFEEQPVKALALACAGIRFGFYCHLQHLKPENPDLTLDKLVFPSITAEYNRLLHSYYSANILHFNTYVAANSMSFQNGLLRLHDAILSFAPKLRVPPTGMRTPAGPANPGVQPHVTTLASHFEVADSMLFPNAQPDSEFQWAGPSGSR